MHEFPELNTKRLVLRKTGLSDLPALLKYCNNKNISAQVLNMPYPFTEEDAIARMNFIQQGFMKKERFVFAISMKPDTELIGQIGLHLDTIHNHAEIGYWIAEPFWNQGIASEALGAILKFGFESLDLHKIYATHFPDNTGSGKVLQNNKMIREGELKDHYRIQDAYKSVFQYRLTKEEFGN